MIIRTKDKERLIEIFKSVEFPIEVWAFGSRVNGTAHEGSDLDLVIRTSNKEKLPKSVFLNLKKKIEETTIPIIVELFDWEKLPSNFHPNIEAGHEVLYSSMNNT